MKAVGQGKWPFDGNGHTLGEGEAGTQVISSCRALKPACSCAVRKLAVALGRAFFSFNMQTECRTKALLFQI